MMKGRRKNDSDNHSVSENVLPPAGLARHSTADDLLPLSHCDAEVIDGLPEPVGTGSRRAQTRAHGPGWERAAPELKINTPRKRVRAADRRDLFHVDGRS